jgi:hypothetical protein
VHHLSGSYLSLSWFLHFDCQSSFGVLVLLQSLQFISLALHYFQSLSQHYTPSCFCSPAGSGLISFQSLACSFTSVLTPRQSLPFASARRLRFIRNPFHSLHIPPQRFAVGTISLLRFKRVVKSMIYKG